MKTQCKRGHVYTTETTVLNKRGHRSCRICKYMRRAENFRNFPQIRERERRRQADYRQRRREMNAQVKANREDQVSS